MIRKRIFLFLTVFFFCFALPVNAKSKKKQAVAEQTQKENFPQWLTDQGRLSMFPSAQYISVCSYGENPDEAKSKAAASVSEFVKSTVTSSVESRMAESEKNGVVIASKNITETASVNAQNELYQLEYTTPFFYEKTGLFACVAYINRDKAFEVLKPKLDKGSDFFPDACSKAFAMEDAFSKLVAVYDAQKLMDSFYEVYDFVCAINPDRAKNYAQYDELYTLSLVKARELKKEAEVFVQVENDNADSVKNALMTTLEKKGFSVVKSSSAKYLMSAKVSAEIQKADGVYVLYPSLSLEVLCNGKNVFTYAENYGKAAGFDENGAKRKAYSLVCKKIEEKLFE